MNNTRAIYLFLVAFINLSGCRLPDDYDYRSPAQALQIINQTSDSVRILVGYANIPDLFQTIISPGDSVLEGPFRTESFLRPFETRISGTVAFIRLKRGNTDSDSCAVFTYEGNDRMLWPRHYEQISRYRPDIDLLYRYRITEADFDSLEVCP